MHKPQSNPIDAHLLKQLFEAVQERNSDLNFNCRKDYCELEETYNNSLLWYFS